MSTQLANTPVWRRLAAAIIIPSALLVLSGCGSTGSDIAGDLSTAVEQAAPEGGLFRELLFEAESGFYVDSYTTPRYVLSPEEANGLIICGECEDRRALE